jgi:hypothetical protein
MKQLRTIKVVPLQEAEASHHFDFGVVDERGRKVGYHIRAFRVDSEPTTERCGHVYEDADPVSEYRVWCHVTRNGANYGASNGSIDEATLEAAMLKAYDKLDACKKRYVKKYAK